MEKIPFPKKCPKFRKIQSRIGDVLHHGKKRRKKNKFLYLPLSLRPLHLKKKKKDICFPERWECTDLTRVIRASVRSKSPHSDPEKLLEKSRRDPLRSVKYSSSGIRTESELSVSDRIPDSPPKPPIRVEALYDTILLTRHVYKFPVYPLGSDPSQSGVLRFSVQRPGERERAEIKRERRRCCSVLGFRVSCSSGFPGIGEEKICRVARGAERRPIPSVLSVPRHAGVRREGEPGSDGRMERAVPLT